LFREIIELDDAQSITHWVDRLLRSKTGANRPRGASHRREHPGSGLATADAVEGELEAGRAILSIGLGKLSRSQPLDLARQDVG
jgi:hypothetical protein